VSATQMDGIRCSTRQISEKSSPILCYWHPKTYDGMVSISIIVGISVNETHTGTVSDFTNSGNPIVKLPQATKRIVVNARDGKQIDEGDNLKFSIQSTNRDHHLANLLSHAPAGTHHNHNSTPNIPIHHDGNSATASRSEKSATQSVEDRKFDPKTHGAPKTSKEKPKRKFLRTDE